MVDAGESGAGPVGFLPTTVTPKSCLPSTQPWPQPFPIDEHATPGHDVCQEEWLGFGVLNSYDVNATAGCRRQLCAQIDHALQARIAEVDQHVDVARRGIGSRGRRSKKQREANVLLSPERSAERSYQRPRAPYIVALSHGQPQCPRCRPDCAQRPLVHRPPQRSLVHAYVLRKYREVCHESIVVDSYVRY
jgi:hypothetical protein